MMIVMRNIDNNEINDNVKDDDDDVDEKQEEEEEV